MPWPKAARVHILLLFLLPSGVWAQEPSPVVKSVLLLLPEDTALPAMAMLVASLRSALWEASGGPVTVDVESLDLGWATGPEYKRALLAWYVAKYRERKPDALVTLRTDAIRLALELRQELWPDIPVVVLSEDERLWEHLPRPERVAGQQLHYDMRGTAELALQLLPGTRRLAFISGSSPWEQAQQQQMLRELRPLLQQRRLELLDLSGLPLATTLERLKNLPADTAVLIFAFITDPTGRPYVPREIAQLLLTTSNRPCFVVHETFLGLGFTGGVLVSYEAVGQQLGLLTARVLRGEQAAFSAPLERVPVDRPTVDARALRRWGIPRDRVPPGMRVVFDEPSLWERYRLYLLGALTLITLQTLLLAVLGVERRRRRRAQAELTERQRLEELAEREMHRTRDQLAHVSRVAALGELATSIAHELNQPLSAILSNAQAARRFLNATPAAVAEVHEALGDIIADDKRAGEIIRRMHGMLKRGQAQQGFHSLNELVREVVRLVANDMLLNRTELHLLLEPLQPAVRGDGIQLQQVLLNLLLNALDALGSTPAGHRHIWVQTLVLSQEKVSLSVQDSGSGIEPSQLPLIFEPFYSTKAKGLGMGLSISRSLIEAHGGQIHAESPPGQGARIWCVLPAAPPGVLP